MLVVVLAACIALGGEVSPAVAQPPAKNYALTSKAAQSQLKSSIASITVVSVRLVNTLYNAGPPSERGHLASTIAALIRKESKDNPSLAMVVALHVQFLKRGAWHAKTIDTIEFRRDQAGSLSRHATWALVSRQPRGG